MSEIDSWCAWHDAIAGRRSWTGPPSMSSTLAPSAPPPPRSPGRVAGGGEGEGGVPPAVPVPPSLGLVLPPQRLDVHGVLADEVGCEALDERLRREARFRKLRDRLAPPDLAVVRDDSAETEVPQRVEVVRLGVADGDRFDRADFHAASKIGRAS